MDRPDRQVPRPARPAVGQPPRRVALRRRHRVRDLRRPPQRRLRAARLQDHRLRRDVASDPQQSAGVRPGARHPRGLQEPQPAVRRHRVRRVRVDRRRAQLAAADERPADRRGRRPRRASARRGSHRRHARPQLLHSRHQSAAAADRRDPVVARAPLRGEAGDGLRPEGVQRRPVPGAGTLGRREPARRRDDLLLPGKRRDWRRDRDDRGQGRTYRAAGDRQQDERPEQGPVEPADDAGSTDATGTRRRWWWWWWRRRSGRSTARRAGRPRRLHRCAAGRRPRVAHHDNGGAGSAAADHGRAEDRAAREHRSPGRSADEGRRGRGCRRSHERAGAGALEAGARVQGHQRRAEDAGRGRGQGSGRPGAKARTGDAARERDLSRRDQLAVRADRHPDQGSRRSGRGSADRVRLARSAHVEDHSGARERDEQGQRATHRRGQ